MGAVAPPLTVQPSFFVAFDDTGGAYLLMGYSGGGNLAYHVTRVLEAQGKRVARVVMFDSARNLAQVEYDRDLARQLARDYMDADGFRPYGSRPIFPHSQAMWGASNSSTVRSNGISNYG
jgi:hypothetical protein